MVSGAEATGGCEAGLWGRIWGSYPLALAGVLIGVVAQCQASVCPLDLIQAGTRPHAEQVVVTRLLHHRPRCCEGEASPPCPASSPPPSSFPIPTAAPLRVPPVDKPQRCAGGMKKGGVGGGGLSLLIRAAPGWGCPRGCPGCGGQQAGSLFPLRDVTAPRATPPAPRLSQRCTTSKGGKEGGGGGHVEGPRGDKAIFGPGRQGWEMRGRGRRYPREGWGRWGPGGRRGAAGAMPPPALTAAPPPVSELSGSPATPPARPIGWKSHRRTRPQRRSFRPHWLSSLKTRLLSTPPSACRLFRAGRKNAVLRLAAMAVQGRRLLFHWSVRLANEVKEWKGRKRWFSGRWRHSARWESGGLRGLLGGLLGGSLLGGGLFWGGFFLGGGFADF